jgi:hypothetical protein
MNTLDELLDEAAQLDKDALVLLLEGVKRLLRIARAFDLTPRGRRYRLIPLDEMEYCDLRKNSIAIKECWVPWLARTGSRERLNLAQAYVVLRKQCGKGMTGLDTYKEAYSFPFEMIVAHDGHDVSYLFVVATYKSSLEMRFRKAVPANDPRLKEPIYYPPEEELDKEEQTYFQVYFTGFLEGLFETMSAIPVEPFVFHIPAAGVVFGCIKGSCFEDWYENPEEAEEAFGKCREQVALESEERSLHQQESGDKP